MSSTKIIAVDGSGSFDAFVAMPPGEGTHGVVVLIQEIFGINESMRETARQVADQGFIVVAPDLFWRIRPGVDLTDKSDAEWKEAFALMNAFDGDKGVEDLKATVAAARTNQLRELEADGLITRKVYAQVPPKVEYSLSPLGRSMEPVLLSLKAWGTENMALFTAPPAVPVPKAA